MSTVTFEVSGILTAFHVSRSAGVVVCLAGDLSALDMDVIGRIGPNMEAVVSVSVSVPVTGADTGDVVQADEPGELPEARR